MSKTRVFVSENGDYEGTPTIVIVKVSTFTRGDGRDGDSFEEFMAKCAKKLKVEKKFTKCFYITNGAEVDDPEDLMPEDKVFVSEGEDFKKKEAEGMLSGGLAAVAGGATSLYGAMSGFAKSKMSDDMKKKFEDAEKKVSDKMAPMVEKVKEVSAPAVDWADKNLEVASEKLKEKKEEFLKSDTAKYLNEKVAKPATAQAKVLYGLASSELKKIGEQGKEKGQTLQEYMKSVQTKMGKEWDSKYAPAVKQLYEQAKEKGKEGSEKLQQAWQQKVEPILKAQGMRKQQKKEEEEEGGAGVELAEPAEPPAPEQL
eukprot:jgi/Bigna1/86793/estExt_fgenesh1_pg.C_140010